MLDTRHWLIALLSSLAAGTVALVTGSASPGGVAVLLPLLGLGALAVHHGRLAPLSALALVVLGIVLALHAWPGFDNPRLWEERRFCHGCLPHSLFFSVDQALLVAAWLPLLWGSTQAASWRRAAVATAITLAATILLGLALGLFRWDSGWPTSALLVFAIANLIAVAAEELLFRGLLQQHLLRPLGAFHAWWITAVLFGLAHLPFSAEFALIATIAGLGYGYVAWQTGSLWPAIGLHWGLNLLHFTLFSYPLLA